MNEGRTHVAICICNDGYEASLQYRKVYDLVLDENALEKGLLRVVDESGEDYLFPKDYFIPVDLPEPYSLTGIPQA